MSSLLDEIRIAQEVRAQLVEIGRVEDDDELLHDMIEGETSLLPMLERIARKARLFDAHAASCRQRAQELEKRARRWENRQRIARSTIAWAMQEAGLKKHEAADVTITVRPGVRSVVITDEAAIPESYIRVTTAPDKARIKAALSEGVAVPGATLGNAEPVLMIGV